MFVKVTDKIFTLKKKIEFSEHKLNVLQEKLNKSQTRYNDEAQPFLSGKRSKLNRIAERELYKMGDITNRINNVNNEISAYKSQSIPLIREKNRIIKKTENSF